ncbi:MAG: hypothetical protein R3326_01565 [Gemmatimonadota bacterium]|nr:hypothetical protein [Gemmatimonadota bacterium]
MRTPAWSVVALTLALGAACATTPRPGETGYPYNVEGVYQSDFVVEGTAYRGTTELETEPGGAVRGDFSVERPVGIVGEVSGTISNDSLSFSGTYSQSTGCDGTISGRGEVSEGGDRVEGPLRVDDSCGGVLQGTFEFDRGES